MRPASRIVTPAVCLALGFGLGAATWNLTPSVNAQTTAPSNSAPKTVDISEANAEKIKQASEAIAVAHQALVQDGKAKPAVNTINAYVVLAGGVDALADLESGRGVDPITFAGLYNGEGVDEVLPHLGNDSMGRLTYKGKLVRMYPIERMRELEQHRLAILDRAAGGSGSLGDLLAQ